MQKAWDYWLSYVKISRWMNSAFVFVAIRILVISTQADATHFSSCRGKIDSRNGLYEGMMDDAINVHGTYLKIKQRLMTIQ